MSIEFRRPTLPETILGATTVALGAYMLVGSSLSPAHSPKNVRYDTSVEVDITGWTIAAGTDLHTDPYDAENTCFRTLIARQLNGTPADAFPFPIIMPDSLNVGYPHTEVTADGKTVEWLGTSLRSLNYPLAEMRCDGNEVADADGIVWFRTSAVTPPPLSPEQQKQEMDRLSGEQLGGYPTSLDPYRPR